MRTRMVAVPLPMPEIQLPAPTDMAEKQHTPRDKALHTPIRTAIPRTMPKGLGLRLAVMPMGAARRITPEREQRRPTLMVGAHTMPKGLALRLQPMPMADRPLTMRA